MNNISKRIVAAAVSLSIVAADSGLAGLCINSTEVVPAVKAAADETAQETDSGSVKSDNGGLSGIVFDLDAPISDVTSEQKANDPYQTYGDRWKSVYSVPEVYINAGVDDGHEKSFLHDVNNGSTKTVNDTEWSYTANVMVSLNVGYGKKDAIAMVRSDSNGGVSLHILNAEGHGRTEGSVVNILKEYRKDEITKKITLRGTYNRNYASGYSISVGSNNYLKKSVGAIDPYSTGQYLSVAAGGFSGEGKDTIIVYDGNYNNPALKQYGTELFSVDTSYDQTEGGTKEGYVGTMKYDIYRPVQIGTIISNLYTEFGLEKIGASSDADISKNVPIVDLVAADVDRDGRDELIVTAGLGNTTSDNSSVTKMKIYDFYNGEFHETYSLDLKGTYYSNKSGRLMWCSSAVGNISLEQVGTAGDLDYPEIVSAGWVNLKDKGMNLKHDYGIHTTKLIGLEKIGDSYVGKYESGNTYHTSDEVLSAKHPDGVSEQMRDGFHADDGAPADRVKRDKLAVAVVAARGLGAESYVVLGDTVYELGKDGSNGLSYVMTSTKNKDYSIRKALTGNYTGDATEGVYFLAIDDENQYHIFYYTYNGTD